MSEDATLLHKPAPEISAEALQRAEEMIEKEEGVQNKLSARMAAFVTAVAVVMSLFHLYTAYAIVRPEHLRSIHLAFRAVPRVSDLSRLRSASATASCGGIGCSHSRASRPRST
jgi:hypothetical protein